MAKHAAGDSSHGDSRTYGGSRNTIDQRRLGESLKAKGAVKGDVPKGKPLPNGK